MSMWQTAIRVCSVSRSAMQSVLAQAGGAVERTCPFGFLLDAEQPPAAGEAPEAGDGAALAASLAVLAAPERAVVLAYDLGVTRVIAPFFIRGDDAAFASMTELDTCAFSQTLPLDELAEALLGETFGHQGEDLNFRIHAVVLTALWALDALGDLGADGVSVEAARAELGRLHGEAGAGLLGAMLADGYLDEQGGHVRLHGDFLPVREAFRARDRVAVLRLPLVEDDASEPEGALFAGEPGQRFAIWATADGDPNDLVVARPAHADALGFIALLLSTEAPPALPPTDDWSAARGAWAAPNARFGGGDGPR